MAAGLPSWSPCWAARSPCTPPKRFGRPDVLASQAMTPAPSSPHAIPAGVHVVSSRKEARQSDTRKSQPKPSWSDAQMREKSPSKRSPKMASPSTRPRAKSASCERRRRPLHPPQRRAECVLDDEACCMAPRKPLVARRENQASRAHSSPLVPWHPATVGPPLFAIVNSEFQLFENQLPFG
ncbi:unnamed protein product [Durusdinium trenchii]|uniref:Uncharacterized protein n=1 Tax=Durusdinium trenchii TaxID=1381693 RepID=A0ABP0S8X7_9DINO